MTVVHGRDAIVADVAASAVKEFVSRSFATLLGNADFRDALPGHLSTMYGARRQVDRVLDRFQQIAGLENKRTSEH